MLSSSYVDRADLDSGLSRFLGGQGVNVRGFLWRNIQAGDSNLSQACKWQLKGQVERGPSGGRDPREGEPEAGGRSDLRERGKERAWSCRPSAPGRITEIR